MEFQFIYPDGYILRFRRNQIKKLKDSLVKNDYLEIFNRLKSILNSRENFDELASNHDIEFKRCNACKTHIAKYEYIEYELQIGTGYIIKFHNNVVYKSDVRYCHRGKESECPASGLNPNSTKFYSLTMGISEDEALNFLKSKNKSPFYRENFISDDDYANNQKRDLRFFQNRYGKEDGIKKFNQFTYKIRNSLTKEVFESRHGEGSYEIYCKSKDSFSVNAFMKKGFTAEESIKKHQEVLQKTRTSLEGFIMRHGKELGTEKYNMFISKKSYQMTEQYYIQKHGDVQGKEIWKNIRKGFSCNLEKFITNHGEELGKAKYLKWLSSKARNGGYSLESINFMKEFIDIEKCYYAENEFKCWDPVNKRIFFYDFYFPRKKLIIEYDTPFCHPNPNFMSEKEFYEWSNPFILMNPEDKYKLDCRKEELLIEKGYKFHRCYIRDEQDRIDNKLIIKKLLS